ncbi:hypothetical protein ACUOG4_22960, partial [Escherichia coli]
MKAALTPYAHQHSYLVNGGSADPVVPLITDSLPYVTAHANANRVVVSGVDEDLAQAGTIVENYNARIVNI